MAVAAVVGLLLWLQARDESTIAQEPGQLEPDQGSEHRRPPAGFKYATDPPTSGPHLPSALKRGQPLTNDQLLHALEQGNVVMVYGNPADVKSLRVLRDDIAGPYDPATVAAGSAIILTSRPGTQGVTALAWRRMLRVPSAEDPRLQEFADAWLGRGAAPQ